MGGIYKLRSMLNESLSKRYETCSSIIQNDVDPSLRVEAIWVLGESFNEITKDMEIKNNVENLMTHVLKNDPNDIVKHEVCFFIGENNIRSKIPLLREVALNDPSELVRHESIEALGLLQDFESKDTLIKALNDPNSAVKQTAEVVLKQLERAQNSF